MDNRTKYMGKFSAYQISFINMGKNRKIYLGKLGSIQKDLYILSDKNMWVGVHNPSSAECSGRDDCAGQFEFLGGDPVTSEDWQVLNDSPCYPTGLFGNFCSTEKKNVMLTYSRLMTCSVTCFSKREIRYARNFRKSHTWKDNLKPYGTFKRREHNKFHTWKTCDGACRQPTVH